MIRRLLILLAILGIAAAPLSATEQKVFARAYDLNVPTIAATTNRIVASVNLTNISFTIAAQPDVPRNLTGTVTDTTPSVVAGTVTFTGTDVNDAVQTEVWDFATALTFTGTKVFKTVTSATAAGATVLGGAGDETIVVGVGSVVSYIYCATGDRVQSPARVITSGSTTTVTTVGGASAFGAIAVGDEIFAKVGQTIQRRTVTAKAGSFSITISSAANWQNGTSGYPFEWRHRVCGYADTDGWQPATDGLSNPSVKIENGTGAGAAMTATGGLDVSIECRLAGDDGYLPAQLVAMNMTNILRPTFAEVVPVLETCTSFRVGLKWGTVDTSGADSVSAYLISGVTR